MPGDVSHLGETRFDYHLMTVMDKRAETTIPYEDINDRIEQYLRERKVQKERGLYLENLKENTTVERLLAEDPR